MKIIAWIFSVLLFIFGVASLATNILWTICFVLMGLILLPPLNEIIKNKTKFKVKWWMKTIVIIILFIPIIGFAEPSDPIVQETNTQQEIIINTIQPILETQAPIITQVIQETIPTPTQVPVASVKPVVTQAPVVKPVTTQAPVVKPNEGNDIIVYRTNTGAKYHNSGCSYLSKSKIEISLVDAKSTGLTPCSKCHPPE